jgi:YVTN family beta-propeller protein
VAIAPDGQYAYVTNYLSGSVSVIDGVESTTSSVSASTLSVGSDPYGVAITPNGAYAYVSNRASNTMDVIEGAETASPTLSPSSLAVGSYPTGVGMAEPVLPTLDVTPATLKAATVGTSYAATLTASGGKSPYKWSISSGSLPAGLVLSSAGVISGKPTKAGTSSFTVKVSDSSSPALSVTKRYSLTVS